MTLITEYPWYYIVLCLLIGLAFAALLYWLPLRRLGETGRDAGTGAVNRREAIWLSVLRTLSVAAIAFLLSAPLVKRQVNRKEKPIIIIAEDNSKSIDYGPDSAFYHTDYQKIMDNLAADLAADFDVQRYTYGAAFSKKGGDGSADGGSEALFSGQHTDIAQPLKESAELYYRRNVAAMIVTGDGIQNSGLNPVGFAEALPFPVYAVAMGDTTVRRDAAVANVNSSRMVYLGNSFPVEITVTASRLKGENSTLTVSYDGKKVLTKPLHFTSGHYTTTETVLISADRAGLHNCTVEVAPLGGEQTLRNNRRVVPIEVIDGHQKIAIIAAAPHPDVAALCRTVERNSNYEVETFLARDFNKNVADYNLLVFHNLPSKIPEASIDMEKLLKSGLPAIFILGSQTDLPRLNALHVGLEVFSRIDNSNEAAAMRNADFTYFTLDDEVAYAVEQFPPLASPFGDYKLSGNSQTLFFQKIGTVNSGMPLVAMTQQQEHRYTFIAGDGLWRWRLADFQNSQSWSNFDGVVNKIITFTALRVNKERFHVEVKSLFSETDPVLFEAQLFNDNFELVNTPDVSLEVSALRETGAAAAPSKVYSFNRHGSSYSINIGTLPPATYRYTAKTRFNGRDYTASGSFIVEDIQLEAVNLVADHSLLATMAATTGGAMVADRDAEQLAEMIRERDDIKTIIFSDTHYSNMLNLPAVFIIIILLLSAEWIVRKLIIDN